MDMRDLINIKGRRRDAVKELERLRLEKVSATQSGNGEAVSAASKAFDAQLEIVKRMNEEIEDAEAVIVEKGRFDKQDAQFVTLEAGRSHAKEASAVRSTLDDVRGSREYAKSFQQAMQSRVSVDFALGREEYAPLTKALTITGGDTAGEDGGFLVPIEFDGLIHKETKDFFDISKLCRTEMVSTNTGWRAVEVAGQRTKLSRISEMGSIGTANQPKFAKVSYTLSQYADRLPVSNQLLQDVPNLLSYLAQWFGPKLILTKNDILLSLLKSLTFAPQTANTDALKVKALKSILNTGLNTAHSRAASILTNQTVYDELDNLVDGNGRAMLVSDLSGDFERFKGRPLYRADNDEIGTHVVTVDDTTTVYNPLFIGNFAAFATLFDRGVMEMATTNIGGDAWATNSTEVRVICRMDAQIMDSTAVKFTGYEQQD